MTFKAVLLWGLFSVVCLVFVEAVKSRPVGDATCHMVKQGACTCHCVERQTSRWGNLADLYKRLFIGPFSPRQLEIECSKCEAECNRHVTANCANGVCHKHGCECSACWTGKSCNRPVNKHTPQFDKSVYTTRISDVQPGSLVVSMEATDKDSKRCNERSPCPCADILYSISSGNDDGYFSIDKHSGKIRVAKTLEKSASFVIGVTASNPDGKQTSSKVTIDHEISEHVRERRSADHHIVRRSAALLISPSVIIESSPIVSNNTFYNIGDKINFNMTAYHNQSAVSKKPTASLKFKCSSKFLDINENPFTHTGAAPSNKAVASGVLTFDVNTLGANDKITIEFEVTVTSKIHPLAPLGVTCEATTTQYKAGPKTSLPTLYAVFPKVSLTRVTTPAASHISVDTKLQYKMTVSMPYLEFALNAELTTAINDFSFMEISEVTVSAESNVKAGSGGTLTPSVQYHKSNQDLEFNDRAVLDFKNVTLVADSSQNSQITITWSVLFSDHPSVANGSKYWVGCGIASGSHMLNVNQQAIISRKVEPAVACTVTPQNNTITTRFYINDTIGFDFVCKHTNTSTANAQNLKIHITSTYLKFVGGTYTPPGGSPLSLPVHNDTSFGVVTVPTFNTDQSVSGTFLTTVQYNISPLVLATPHITINYQNSAGKDKMSTTHTPKTPPSIAVPSIGYNVTSRIASYMIGSLVQLKLTINMARLRSHLEIELISPVNTSYPMTSIQNVRSPTVGAKITDYANIAKKPINCRSTVNQTINDRCKIDLGIVESMDDSGSSQDHEIEILFDVRIEDHPAILNGSKIWQAVGLRGGDKMMWIGEIAFPVVMGPEPKPDLNLKSDCYLADTSTKCIDGKVMRGDKVQFNFTLTHALLNSEQYAENVKIQQLVPPTLSQFTFIDIQYVNLSAVEFTPPTTVTLNGPFRFDEKLSFSINAIVDSANFAPAGTTLDAFSLGALTYTGHDKNKVFSRNTEISLSYTTPPDASSSKPELFTWSLKEFYCRGLFVIPESNTLYVCSCDGIAHSSCYVTVDGGDMWEAMDPQVGCIIGYAQGTLFGISTNRRAYMKLVDGTWYNTNSDDWKAQAGKNPSSNLKIISGGGSDSALEDQSKNGYKGNSTGVYFRQGVSGNWERKAAWKCCGAT